MLPGIPSSPLASALCSASTMAPAAGAGARRNTAGQGWRGALVRRGGACAGGDWGRAGACKGGGATAPMKIENGPVGDAQLTVAESAHAMLSVPAVPSHHSNPQLALTLQPLAFATHTQTASYTLLQSLALATHYLPLFPVLPADALSPSTSPLSPYRPLHNPPR